MPDVDPTRDLTIERHLAASPATIWRCWSEPDLFKRWFTPPPVEVADCALDLSPGGRFYTVMKLPDGTVMEGDGCFLLVEHLRRLVFTDALQPGFRPSADAFFTADITLTPDDAGTVYAVHVMHENADARTRHEGMGFHDGWNTTITQLDSLAQSL